jgi:hypothetical protein
MPTMDKHGMRPTAAKKEEVGEEGDNKLDSSNELSMRPMAAKEEVVEEEGDNKLNSSNELGECYCGGVSPVDEEAERCTALEEEERRATFEREERLDRYLEALPNP